MYTHEPTDGPIGRLIRRFLNSAVQEKSGKMRAGEAFDSKNWEPEAETMALLYTADRMDHQKFLKEKLSSGQTVICDRYHYSTLAYQSATSGHEGGHAETYANWMVDLADYCLKPDLVIVLDVDPRVAADRRAGRGNDAEVYEVPELQKKLAKIYGYFPDMKFEQCTLRVSSGFAHVDANCPEDEVFEQCLRLIGEIDE